MRRQTHSLPVLMSSEHLQSLQKKLSSSRLPYNDSEDIPEDMSSVASEVSCALILWIV